jgi:hypothetical protein
MGSEVYMQELLSYAEVELLFKRWKIKSLTYTMWILFFVGVFLSLEILIIRSLEQLDELIFVIPIALIFLIASYVVKRIKHQYKMQVKEIKPLQYYKSLELEGVKFPMLYNKRSSKRNEWIPVVLVLTEHAVFVKELKQGYRDIHAISKSDVRFVFTEVYKGLEVSYQKQMNIYDHTKRYAYHDFDETFKKLIPYLLLEYYQVEIIKK